MRFLGGIMILTGCTGLGFWYREQLEGRMRALRSLIMLLEVFISEIRYGRSALPECCKAVASKVEEPYRSGLLEVCEQFADNRENRFGEIFVYKMDKVLQLLPLKKSDKECFFSSFLAYGFWDGQMQIKNLEYSRGHLADVLQTQKQLQQEKSRLAVGLGVMSGLLLVIVMV